VYVPSPAAIAREAAACRAARGEPEDVTHLTEAEQAQHLDDDAQLPAALIRRAVDDVESLERAVKAQPPMEFSVLKVRAERAALAMYWLLSERPVGPDWISFEEACLLAGCRDADVVRQSIRNTVKLSPVSLAWMRSVCS
jgi:hypothetical protein